MTFPLRVTSMIWHLEVPKINKSSKKFEKTKLCKIQTSADFKFLKKAYGFPKGVLWMAEQKLLDPDPEHLFWEIISKIMA